jgi:hypothetical protein
VKYISGFAAFWYDFLVGDSMVLAIGGIGVIAFAYLLVEAGAASAAEFVMPAVVIATLAVSLIKPD